MDTCWYIKHAIKRELQTWRKQKPTQHDLQRYPTELQAAILAQRQIGWRSFLEGRISQHWTTYMAEHYRDLHSKRSAEAWTAKLIKHTHEILKAVWDSRNSQLHETIQILELEGLPMLKDAIKAEFGIGLGRLPASEFSSYFTIKLNIILQKSVDQLKHWLMVISQARILMDAANVLDDEFSNSKALQQWIGISTKVTDKEGMEQLHDSIEKEYKIGIGNLPPTLPNYFKMTLKEILQRDLDWKKSWLCDIKDGRDEFDSANVINDSFAHPGVLREWLETC